MNRSSAAVALLLLLAVAAPPARPAEPPPAPSPAFATGGEGPFPRLILRGVTLIDGTGAPPIGPMDVVIEKERIAELVSVGAPGVPIEAEGRPKARPGDRELDLAGHYLLPGFVDLYGHLHEPLDYTAKLFLAHGVTTAREPICRVGVPRCLELRETTGKGRSVAPRVVPFVSFGLSGPGATMPLPDEASARRWVAETAKAGAAGVRFRDFAPAVFAAAVDEARKRNLRTSVHLDQLLVARADALDAARAGVDILEHWYGLPEALLDGATLQDFPADYNYNEEQQRFAAAGRLWRQAAPPGSERWNAVVAALAEEGLTLVPTLSLYEANRDLMRARTAEWHPLYTLPQLWDSFAPNRAAHAAHWFDWTTEEETEWRRNYRLWMEFLQAYKNRGGRVAVGSDSGFMYSLHGFAYVRELELLREAGFHPLEVIRAATLDGARALGLDGELGSVEPGKRADLVVVAENPLANLKVLYGTGALKLDAENRPVRVGGVRWTIKDGVLHDAPALLAEVRRTVAEAWAKAGRTPAQPGMAPPPPGSKP
ncbi:MAG TPA: amidohydrolase family protein [Thermoanaerobaculia bacterium]|nr:amidohydrolase family protein [Thermoanaerobaculia bacterium]